MNNTTAPPQRQPENGHPAAETDRFCDYITSANDAKHAIIAGIDTLIDNVETPAASRQLLGQIRNLVWDEFGKVDARFMSYFDRAPWRKCAVSDS